MEVRTQQLKNFFLYEELEKGEVVFNRSVMSININVYASRPLRLKEISLGQECHSSRFLT